MKKKKKYRYKIDQQRWYSAYVCNNNSATAINNLMPYRYLFYTYRSQKLNVTRVGIGEYYWMCCELRFQLEKKKNLFRHTYEKYPWRSVRQLFFFNCFFGCFLISVFARAIYYIYIYIAKSKRKRAIMKSNKKRGCKLD